MYNVACGTQVLIPKSLKPGLYVVGWRWDVRSSHLAAYQGLPAIVLKLLCLLCHVFYRLSFLWACVDAVRRNDAGLGIMCRRADCLMMQACSCKRLLESICARTVAVMSRRERVLCVIFQCTVIVRASDSSA